jgi:glycosyltransferase involved in cell wall biosynthesis
MNSCVGNPTFSFLLICQTYPPVIGGSEIEAQRVCGALIQRGHRVTVVCGGGAPMPAARDWVDPQGVPVRIYAGHQAGVYNNVSYALHVAGMLLRERSNYQFVYFLMQGLHWAVGLPLAWLLKKPVVVKIAGSGEVGRMHKSPIGRMELRWINRWARRILILNEGMRQEAIDYGLSPQRLFLMPNPVDTNEFSPATTDQNRQLRERFHIPQTAPVVMYSGRLAAEKSLPTLLEAFALVLRTVPDTVLVLVGDGPVRSALSELASKLGLNQQNIRFTGRVEPQDVPSWLKIATVFTLVSPSEGFPCALEEAMSTGVASVVTDIPGNRQLVQDGLEGILVPVGDTQKIAEAISLLIQNNGLRQDLGRKAREQIVENYSTQRVVELYESVFQADP